MFCKMLIRSCNNLEDRLNYLKESAANTKRAQAEARARQRYQTKIANYNEKMNKYKANQEYASLKNVELEKVNKVLEFQEALKMDVEENNLNQSVIEDNNIEEIEINDLNKSFN